MPDAQLCCSLLHIFFALRTAMLSVFSRSNEHNEFDEVGALSRAITRALSLKVIYIHTHTGISVLAC
jgi:hypothetical protein